MDRPPRRRIPGSRAELAHDAGLLRIVLVMVGMLLTWQLVGSVVDSASGFAVALAAGVVATCYLWRERVTFDLVADLALIGLPAVVIGLSLS